MIFLDGSHSGLEMNMLVLMGVRWEGGEERKSFVYMVMGMSCYVQINNFKDNEACT